MSYLAASNNSILDFSNLIFLAAVISVFFGYANFVLVGYFKDISADKATSYNTLPVKFGRKIAAVVGDIFSAIVNLFLFILIIALALNSVPFINLIIGSVFIFCGMGMSIFTQISLHSVKADAEAHIAIVPCVHSYIFILSGISILNKPHWFAGMLLFYFFYHLTLKLRPAKEQI